MRQLQPSNELVSDIITLLKQEQRPLYSGEIARKLNKNVRDVLSILFNTAYQKIIQVVINKDETNKICQPSYKIRPENSNLD
ncbi:hypothetical protein NIE88_00790 [Sporolactobacillus shoreicorticis]|uniref:Uncharacterized protein n=1 Tax=Sporolactobacillus shoreicorticis TaxID=1923877 RepID=A0ABW5S485_9BACL|nr:hypothetical protein [Sporolactobacillus shoreicorticis]MCO7124321.1 hypothetical protein [Sporolactobacillus shoreicorticis]